MYVSFFSERKLDWFVFFNKRRDRIKVLAWEGDGLSIWYQ